MNLRHASLTATALALVLTGCGASSTPEKSAAEPTKASAEPTGSSAGPTTAPKTPAASESPEPATPTVQEETCDWGSARVSGPAKAPKGQQGALPDMIVGAWQHTHFDQGSGWEPVTNDHRYVLPSPGRLLYCQHVPGATDHAENAADVTLNGTRLELPGGKISYTVTSWDENTMTWKNPVGRGSVYLLQRR